MNRILTCVVFTACGLLLGGESVFAQQWHEDIGYNRLVAELGSDPDTSGLAVAMPEAPDGSGRYMPSVTGKTVKNGSGTNTGTQSHASSVGGIFYGPNSVANGIDDITGYDANDFLNRVMGYNSGTNLIDPLSDSFDITNHSYVATGGTPTEKFEILSRFDFVINRDNTLAIVGTNNGSGNSTPTLWAHSYNAVVVGLTLGNHARGATSDYGPGRLKPDIVAPHGTTFAGGRTSFSTPMVSSAAAILKKAGMGTNAGENEVIKAMLFAGATKTEFASWDRTALRPVDEEFGFGELNIYNSYKMFQGGEFDGSTTEPMTMVGERGYDFGTFNGTDDLFYDFDIVEDGDVSAALVWNAEVTDSNASALVFDQTVTVANLDLELYDSNGSFLGTLIDSSVSTDYNYEHIYLQDLAAGRYTFRISGDSPVDFGFAWTAVPEPTGSVICGMLLLAAFSRRRR